MARYLIDLPFEEFEIAGLRIPTYHLNSVVVGSGAAGLNCINRLFREMEANGVADPASKIAMVTQGIGLGTSNNCGSDKQTYYKMGTNASEPDMPMDFAETLTAGGCAHADVAMVEAIGSLRSFYRLADLGVPFPYDAEGSFVGYKTDHDPRMRGTSAGPWTSRHMVQRLLAEMNRYEIPVFDKHHLLAIITDNNKAQGILCVDTTRQADANHGLVLIKASTVVIATGGPGELYEGSVYAKGQMGSYWQMFEAGAIAQNLTESQFGIASISPRWNLSGTYQQAIPRYYSTDQEGVDEQEFLNPWFESMSVLCSDIFLKGYQWPFDYDKASDYGSSLIDILVHNEIMNRGRRVFMDFRENPRASDGLEEFDFQDLKSEAIEYLQKSGAVQETPLQRLAHMNPPGIDLYRELNVDLATEPLEIGICSQHCNGGFAVDSWWETNIQRLFAVGEIAGTHGVKRPGGSALNSGQVGGMRAAQRIANVYTSPEVGDFQAEAESKVKHYSDLIRRIKANDTNALDSRVEKAELKGRMSRYAGMVRSIGGVEAALSQAEEQWKRIDSNSLSMGTSGFISSIETHEAVLTQIAFLEAIQALLERGSGSRGSHLVADLSGRLPHPQLAEQWRFIPEKLELRDEIQQIRYCPEQKRYINETIRPSPRADVDNWFETVWAQYRSGAIYQK